MVDMHSKPSAPANAYDLAHNNLWGLVLVDQDLLVLTCLIQPPPPPPPPPPNKPTTPEKNALNCSNDILMSHIHQHLEKGPSQTTYFNEYLWNIVASHIEINIWVFPLDWSSHALVETKTTMKDVLSCHLVNS